MGKDPHEVVFSPEDLKRVRFAVRNIISRPCTLKKYSWAIRMACAISDLELIVEVRSCVVLASQLLVSVVPIP